MIDETLMIANAKAAMIEGASRSVLAILRQETPDMALGMMALVNVLTTMMVDAGVPVESITKMIDVRIKQIHAFDAAKAKLEGKVQ